MTLNSDGFVIPNLKINLSIDEKWPNSSLDVVWIQRILYLAFNHPHFCPPSIRSNCTFYTFRYGEDSVWKYNLKKVGSVLSCNHCHATSWAKPRHISSFGELMNDWTRQIASAQFSFCVCNVSVHFTFLFAFLEFSLQNYEFGRQSKKCSAATLFYSMQPTFSGRERCFSVMRATKTELKNWI